MYKKIGITIFTLWMILSLLTVTWANPLELVGDGGAKVTNPNAGSPEFQTVINSTGPSVGIVAASELDRVENVQGYLSQLGFFSTVDVISYEKGAGASLGELLEYDAILVFNNWQLFAGGFGDTLGDYVDAGGGVVLATFLWQNEPLAGSKIMSPGYSPFASAGHGHYSWAELGWYDASHPIMNGVSWVKGYFRDEVSLTEGAVLIASWDDEEEYVAANANGTVVGISLYPPTLTSPPEGNYDIVLGNSLLYVAGGASTGSIEGRVTNCQTGDPIEQVLLIAIQKPTRVRTSTDVDGYYNISDLEAGVWWLIGLERGYKLYIAKVEVEIGKTTQHDFCLIPR